MKPTLLKQTILAAAALGLTLFTSASWSANNFTASYLGAGTMGGSCGYSYRISGAEPADTAKHPVFVYMVGTNETYNNASAMAAVNSMAAKGYVAATIEYASGAFGTCSDISTKTSCAFNPNSSASAISQLCSRTSADCTKGIVVAGFSQGSVVATLAKNYDARIQAAFGMGTGVKYSAYDLSSCMANGKRTLTSDRLKVVNGEGDGFMGGSASGVRSQLQTLTGLNCGTGAYSCANSNNSGWQMVTHKQVSDGSAEHCYMRKGGCSINENSLDSGWQTGTASWALESNLKWLTTFTQK